MCKTAESAKSSDNKAIAWVWASFSDENIYDQVNIRSRQNASESPYYWTVKNLKSKPFSKQNAKYSKCQKASATKQSSPGTKQVDQNGGKIPSQKSSRYCPRGQCRVGRRALQRRCQKTGSSWCSEYYPPKCSRTPKVSFATCDQESQNSQLDSRHNLQTQSTWLRFFMR